MKYSSESGAVANTLNPSVSCEKRLLSFTVTCPRGVLMSFRKSWLRVNTVPSPKNLYFDKNAETPTEIGRSLKYGCV